MTSGITSGAVVIPDNNVRPLNGPNRASTKPASVPSTTAPVAETAATLIDNQAASRIGVLCNNSPYHFSVGDAAASQTVTNLELLNEKNIIDRIGRYKNTRPTHSIVVRNTARDFIYALRPVRDFGSAERS